MIWKHKPPNPNKLFFFFLFLEEPSRQEEEKVSQNSCSVSWEQAVGIWDLFYFIHMTRFYTNSQLNSTNLHSWGMLKKTKTKQTQLKKPTFPVTHNPNILQCRGEGVWGSIPNKSLWKETTNISHSLSAQGPWWECNLQFILLCCGVLWKQKSEDSQTSR